MQCAILIGGLGTRLGALVSDCPKPMLPVAGAPFLEHLVRDLARYGFDDVLLLAGYRSEVVERFVAETDLVRRDGLKIRVVVEPEPLGTAGALRYARADLAPEFLMLNGDSFFDFNVLDLATFATDEPWLARMALRRVEDASRFGVVELAEGGIVTAMRERPDGPGLGLINGGVYWLRRDIVEVIGDGQVSLERTVFPALASDGLLRGRTYDGFFLDIGVPDAYAAAGAAMTAALRRPAVFFDRDGVLNHDDGYTHDPHGFRWIDGACEAVRRVNDAGWFAFVVTNQAGVARGYYDEAAVQALHRWMNADLRTIGAHIDAFRYCPHHPDGTVGGYAKACDWRKPGPGMLTDLLDKWPVDAGRSFLLGDKASDLEAARRAGIRGRLYAGGDLAAIVDEEIAAHGGGQQQR